MMEDHEFDYSEIWDEFQWERFLRKQDENTQKYFDLLDQYMDHPERDRIIAGEMGWSSLEDADAFEEAMEDSLITPEEDIEIDCEQEEFDRFTALPVYRDTLKLHRAIHRWMDTHPEIDEEPLAVELATKAAICSAKLAAALCGDEESEIGMTIAYLKRSLKAVNDALSAGTALAVQGKLSPRRLHTLNQRMFRVRNEIVDLMNHYRREWNRRYGSA
jgi:hypothetical protein